MTATFMVSYVLLWVLVIFLGTALLILYSHVGQSLLHSREGHPLQGPDVGKRLEPRVLTTLSGTRYTLGAPSPVPRLVVFVSPRCVSCKQLLKALPEFVERFGPRVETVLVCRGAERDVRAFTSGVPQGVVVSADASGDFIGAYRVLVTPYAFSIDLEGLVLHKGVPGTDAAALAVFLPRLRQAEPPRLGFQKPLSSAGARTS